MAQRATFACTSFLHNKKWTRSEEDAPKEIRRSADAVTDGSKVYIRHSHVKEILVFDLERKKWDETKLECKYFQSSLVIMNDQLIAVGGTVNQADKSPCQSELFIVSTEGNNEWTKMKEPRRRCTAITWKSEGKNLLIVAGGENPVGTTLTTVEILQVTTTSKTWKKVCSLPETIYSCSAAIVKGHLYLLGGWNERQKASNKMFRCSIKDLYEGGNGVWQTPIDLPAAQTTCVAFQDRLLTIGGTWCHCYDCKCSKPTKNIYEYDEKSEEFECIGSTPVAQYLCLACAFDNTIFVAGGAINEKEALPDVYILDYSN